jgi:hypothetical protein
MMKSIRDEQNALRYEAFQKAWALHKQNGFAITQEAVNSLAEVHGIEKPPMLASLVSESRSGVAPMGDGVIFINFENKQETATMVAYLAAKAVIKLHFDLLMMINVLSNEMRAPGTDLPAERVRRLADSTAKWAAQLFPSLGVSVEYKEDR